MQYEKIYSKKAVCSKGRGGKSYLGNTATNNIRKGLIIQPKTTNEKADKQVHIGSFAGENSLDSRYRTIASSLFAYTQIETL